MGEPIRIRCTSANDVASPAELTKLTSSGRHVVLEFAILTEGEKSALIHRLSVALPEHSIFCSGGRRGHSWITVMPVIANSGILAKRDEILRAVAEYRRMCVTLIKQYRTGTLSPEWLTDEHGEHCRFENRTTGQTVEAPLQRSVISEKVDPYFFAEFVRTTPGLEAVADLLENDFHDAARILDVVINREMQRP